MKKTIKIIGIGAAVLLMTTTFLMAIPVLGEPILDDEPSVVDISKLAEKYKGECGFLWVCRTGKMLWWDPRGTAPW